MKNRALLAVLVLLPFTLVNDVQALNLKKIPLDKGCEDAGLEAPVLDAAETTSLTILGFTDAVDRESPVIRKTGRKGKGGVKGHISADVGAVLAEALKSEAGNLGFSLGDDGWKLSGVVETLSVENNGVFMFAFLIYSYMDVSLELVSPDGATTTQKFSLYTYSAQGGRPKGMLTDGVVCHFISSAREILASVNRDHIRAPARESLAQQLDQVRESGKDDDKAIRAVGLSGELSSVPALLQILEAEEDEDSRVPVIDALARLGSPDAIAVLANRYLEEDEDCRWHTLKAFRYIGTDEALAQLKELGAQDKLGYFQKVAERMAQL